MKLSSSGNPESGFTSITDWAKDGQSLVFDSNSITCDKYGSGDNYDNIYGPYYYPNEDQYLADGTVSGTLRACYYPFDPIGSDCATAADPFQRLCPCEEIAHGASVCYHYPTPCSYAADRNSPCCVGCDTTIGIPENERKCLGDPDTYSACWPHCVYVPPTSTTTSTPTSSSTI